MVRKILVAFDGSEKSYEAFNFALDMSKNCLNLSVNIFVLSVAQPPEPMAFTEINPDAIMKGITQYYEELFKGLREKAGKREINIQAEVVMGHPADQIIKYAKEKGCDLIVMGHRGRSKIADWLLGSVSGRNASIFSAASTISITTGRSSERRSTLVVCTRLCAPYPSMPRKTVAPPKFCRLASSTMAS